MCKSIHIFHLHALLQVCMFSLFEVEVISYDLWRCCRQCVLRHIWRRKSRPNQTPKRTFRAKESNSSKDPMLRRNSDFHKPIKVTLIKGSKAVTMWPGKIFVNFLMWNTKKTFILNPFFSLFGKHKEKKMATRIHLWQTHNYNRFDFSTEFIRLLAWKILCLCVSKSS